eukprot:04632.XXX_85441_85701_1 [CDS] Oithona nana genome sequencing.
MKCHWKTSCSGLHLYQSSLNLLSMQTSHRLRSPLMDKSKSFFTWNTAKCSANLAGDDLDFNLKTLGNVLGKGGSSGIASNSACKSL